MTERTQGDLDQLIDEGLNIEKGELDLRERELEDDDIKLIVKSDKLKGVTALFLEFNTIGDEGLQAILDCGNLKHLTALNIFKNQVTDAGVKEMAKSKTLLNLSELVMSDNQIGVEGARALAESKTLANLVSLWVGDQLGDEGAKILVEFKIPHTTQFAHFIPERYREPWCPGVGRFTQPHQVD